VAPRTQTEQAIAAVWAEVLKLDRVGIHDNFFELGGHSLLAVKALHVLNHRLLVEARLSWLFQDATPAALAQRILNTQITEGSTRTESIVANPAAWEEPFPVTDIQRAYLVGRRRDLELGGVGAHAYAEFELPEVDLRRMEGAIDALIQRHGMLRTTFSDAGSQVVLPHVQDYKIELLDLTEFGMLEAEIRLKALRAAISHRVFSPDTWPLFVVRATRLSNARIVLHVSADALIIDAGSAEILRREFEVLYANPGRDLPSLPLSFRDYVLAEEREAKRQLDMALDYWASQFPSTPYPPSLPTQDLAVTRQSPRFERRAHLFGKVESERLKDAAKATGVTPTVFVLTAFIEVLELWSKVPGFTLNLTVFNRRPLHPAVDSLVGDFTTLMMLKTDACASGFNQRARLVQERILGGLEHAVVSGITVSRELARRHGTKEQLLPVVFTSTIGVASAGPAGLLREPAYAITQTPQVWLDHQLTEQDERISIVWDSIDEFFAPGLLDEMFRTYATRLDGLSNDLGESERHLRLTPDPVRPGVPEKNLLHAGFELQAVARPNAVALVCGDEKITYGELRARARTLARLLQATSLGRNQLVGVCTSRGPHQVVAALAVLYAGAAYLPLDADWPSERVESLISDAQASVVLVDELTTALVHPSHAKLDVGSLSVTKDEADLATGVEPDDLAYVIYTSGSTGRPKGVMIQHFAAANTVRDICERYGLTQADGALAVSAFTFDLSVFDIFGLLSVGGRVVLLDNSESMNPASWRSRIAQHAITFWNSVPALMGLLLDAASQGSYAEISSLRTILLSGDWVPLPLVRQLKSVLPDAKLVSLGGATEASIWSIFHEITEVSDHWKSIPYGRPLLNQGVFVLDSEFRQRPTHAVGEIYISGTGVAAGYWNDEQRTRLSFLQHPRTGVRLYRTGDLGRYMNDGSIEFLGREDHQVKVNGYRIELGEVEAAIGLHPMVVASAVVSDSAKSGSKMLVAFVVTNSGETLTVPALQEFLAAQLPRYMIPTQIWFVRSLPLTANGKVDRKSLLAHRPLVAFVADDASELTVSERRIFGIVRETLQLPDLDLRENLLVAGATSLDLIRISNAMADEFDFEPELMRFLDEPSAHELLQMYRERTGEGDRPLPLADVEEISL